MASAPIEADPREQTGKTETKSFARFVQANAWPGLRRVSPLPPFAPVPSEFSPLAQNRILVILRQAVRESALVSAIAVTLEKDTVTMAENLTGTAAGKNVLWYKSGVIYELHVRAFHDSTGDGTGDFPGLTLKLDYLRDLGVTAIWLLPFYPSPLKDDGYDIADYYGVHPRYGKLSDFKVFLREAHRRGLRVITELVLNHTSDQHPWFQRARRAKPGSRWRDYYVWSDTSEKYQGTRVIFKDTEISNWTWDPVADAYFWHRFYSHQPDLNFDNPVVEQEMFKIVDFWLGLGVDGLRLDAVPYLYEREGTSCENLPETHEFLKRLRKHVDENYGDRMLLGEANQWPEDAVAYFGGGRGDECHMAFHFPLMPRLFMSLRMEDRIPIVDILQQTPPIPETAQWALFLRNHDELTLEMVTDEERDYMYRMYAHVAQARLNLGIRRRLAPLVNNDRKRIELLSALLFSLPGTPVIYYGDEIGMGENIYLGDRNGVRTPMQWSADKNAGFSRANPQSLYLPINLDPENHYEAVNVEVQERNPHSLLWWMKRLIILQKRWKAFGLGSMEFLHPENRKVLAFVRRYQEECILVVANLSRFVQPVELDLAPYQSLVPVELFGRTEFPGITAKPYFLTLGPHSFYLFSLEAKAPARVESVGAPVGAQARPLLTVEADWEEIFLERNQLQIERALQSWLPSRRWFGGRNRTIKAVHVQEIILLDVSATATPQVSSPAGSGTGVSPVRISSRTSPSPKRTGETPVPLSAAVTTAPESDKAFITFVQVEYVETEPELYFLPLACAFGKSADTICRDWPALVIARVTSARAGSASPANDHSAAETPAQTPGDGVLHDAIASKAFCQALLELISRRQKLDGRNGGLEATHTAILRRLRMEGAHSGGVSASGAGTSDEYVLAQTAEHTESVPAAAPTGAQSRAAAKTVPLPLEALEPVASKAEHGTSAIIYGDQLILKLFRRLETGLNPDLEITRFLTAQKFPHAPSLAGALEFRNRKDETITLGVLSSYVAGSKYAWEYTLDALGRFYERVQTLPAERRQPPAVPTTSIPKLANIEMPAPVREMIGTYLESARLIGQRTAELHLALAAETEDPNFAPEPATSHSQRGLYQSMRNLTRQNFQLLNKRLNTLPPEIQAQAQQVLGMEAEILKRFRATYEKGVDGFRIRHHGNYNLGQMLYTGKDFLVVDFEGEPALMLGERQFKRSPLRDVAGMARSFQYAAHAALLLQVERGTLQPARLAAANAWARFWSQWVGAVFFKAYRAAIGNATLLPSREENLHLIFEAYLLRKAVYELGHELNERPGWVGISLESILELAGPVERSAT